MRKMNEIEKKFFKSYLNYEEISEDDEECVLKPHVQIDIYEVDFLFNDEFVIEIDGHDFHKTKEQRFNDYTRERYLMRKGYQVIRFMGTEVFLNAEKCVSEMLEIDNTFTNKKIDHYESGRETGCRVGYSAGFKEGTDTYLSAAKEAIKIIKNNKMIEGFKKLFNGYLSTVRDKE